MSKHRPDQDYPDVTDCLDGLALTTSDQAVQQGDELTITLRNESDETKTTGSNSQYDIQRRKDDAWRTIFWHENGSMGFEEIAITHAPGEGMEWEFVMTAEELSHEIGWGKGYRSVQSPVSPGDYRFVFFGKQSYEDCTPCAVLGIPFTIIEASTMET